MSTLVRRLFFQRYHSFGAELKVSGNRFSVAIFDESSNMLFQSVYSVKKFDKKFKLAEPDSFGKLVFVIRNLGDNSVQRFEVNADTRLVEDVEVKEVK